MNSPTPGLPRRLKSATVWVVFMAQPRKAICVSIMIKEVDVHIPQYEMGAFPIVAFPLVLIMESFNISAYVSIVFFSLKCSNYRLPHEVSFVLHLLCCLRPLVMTLRHHMKLEIP
jgi:hypothetical protein